MLHRSQSKRFGSCETRYPRRTRRLSQRCFARTTKHSSATSLKEEILQAVKVGVWQRESEAALKEKVNQLIANPLPNRAIEALKRGQGTWEVVHAPHIRELSRQLGTTFSPIRYKVDGKKIVSNVRYSSSLFREGWLSASGTIEASGTNTLQVLFDKFWVDFGPTNLREEIPEAKSAFDKSVMAMGRLGFISQFSYFPVQYMDSEGELAVFAFPPLQSSITIRRVQL